MPDVNPLQRLMIRYSGGFVIALHEIAPKVLSGFIDCVRPAQPVHVSELVQRSKERKSTSGLFAITIDDGVGDNVRALSQLFKSRAWPATFYLPTQYLDTGDGMMFQWWRRLKPLLPHRKLELKSGVIDLSVKGALDALSKKMAQRWYSQRMDSYGPMTMELLDIVIRETGMTREAIQPPAPIRWREVEELSRSDLIRFESHGVSHIAMSTLTEEELLFEMRHSRDVVSEHTGRPCRHLAYPFGGKESIGARAVAAAGRFYDSATTMSLGHVDNTNPYLLPRIPFYPENSKLYARLKIALKCMAVSPLKSARVAAHA
jgi:peptidoglycan/xylan/chitin deacetylase (PgdA/CDA1 family)